ncbi:MAG: DUF3307 domain-containing protein [Gemmatimonadota bacterium]|nr:DUF3307 domain-containing protein [Gemmatimonadota bacterium]
MTAQAVLLVSLLLVAHYLGDFSPLASARMQSAKAGNGSQIWILAHAGVHAALVLAAVAVVSRSPSLLLAAAGIEFGTHLFLDVTKMRLSRRSVALRDPTRAPFWYLHGFDQLIHGLVLVWIAALVL